MDSKSRYIIKDREQSTVAEGFRSLRSMIQNVEDGSLVQVVLFAGASPGEGNVMAAVNTAASLAYAGKKVILIDCDLRKPVLQEIFKLQDRGLTNLINEEIQISEVLQDSMITNLKVLTSGPMPSKPLEVLSNAKISEIIKQLRPLADYIIINSSPLIVMSKAIVSDACVLASKVDGVILIIDSMTIRVKVAQKVLGLLKGARAKMIGVVLNNTKGDQDIVY